MSCRSWCRARQVCRQDYPSHSTNMHTYSVSPTFFSFSIDVMMQGRCVVWPSTRR